jgi:hypothetical protein
MRSNPGFDFVKIGIIQPKLKVSQPGDAYEQEAYRVAERVMRMSAPSDSVSSMQAKKEEGIDRKCTACERVKEEEEKKMSLNISRKISSSEGNLETIDEISGQTGAILSSSGSSLDANTKEFIESRFGYDFANVRIHNGEMAAKSARSVNASAYTVRSDIIFGEGQYQLNTIEGRRLLGHELAHVVQQADAARSAHTSVSSPYIQRQADVRDTGSGAAPVDAEKCYNCEISGGLSVCCYAKNTPIVPECLELWKRIIDGCRESSGACLQKAQCAQCQCIGKKLGERYCQCTGIV